MYKVSFKVDHFNAEILQREAEICRAEAEEYGHNADTFGYSIEPTDEVTEYYSPIFQVTVYEDGAYVLAKYDMINFIEGFVFKDYGIYFRNMIDNSLTIEYI